MNKSGTCLLSLFLFSPSAWSQGSETRTLTLERIESVGSQRLPPDFFETELGLKPGITLDDAVLAQARTRILGTGLFRSAQFFLKRGAEPGQARLNIELEDDPSILGSWAWGSSLAVTQDQRTTETLGSELNPLGVRGQLISRNMFGLLHRASAQVDYDGQGILRAFQLGYGFPRFSAEDVQFDARMEAMDPTARYFDTLGFASKGEAFWTLEHGEGSIQYGVALYSNQDETFRLRGFPKVVAGPRVGYMKETRLLGFRTTDGYALGGALVFTTKGTREMSYELEGAWTSSLWPSSSATLQTQILSYGLISLSQRSSLRLEQALPVWNTGDDPLLYVQLTHGSDRWKEFKDEGSEFRLGLRFHSSGLIADFAFTLSRFPERLETREAP